jgi:hypothetical protein
LLGVIRFDDINHIDSISLRPDTAIKTALPIAAAEQPSGVMARGKDV